MIDVKSLCRQYDIKPSKSKGQNFLIDANIVKKIIAAAAIKPKERILEVGPGLGVLTEELAKATDNLVAVELDQKIISYIKTNFPQVDLIAGDILRVNLAAEGFTDFSYRIVANLPYSITAAFLRLFLETGPKPTEMILMLQKEVAKRLIAKPGEMSLLSLSAQLFGEPQILFEVGRGCFWPVPAVDSAVVRIKLKRQTPAQAKQVFRLARIGFAAKRKQMKNNLAGGLPLPEKQVRSILIGLGLDEKIRAQDLSVDDWLELAEAIK
ncbi:MAG: 16S rRNA (adenine(1518)-N(6)/adenine(1519)-N(6))-dimethyltransferase RsmA [Patescibacteria group bacterium]|jgi:16S rRNA (adenine1518-N6/adenine1519-N6)-dimethyltransferase